MKNTIFTKTIATLLIVFALSFAAAAQTPNDADKNFLQALELLKKENFAEAEKSVRRAIATNPKSGEAYGVLAIALGYLGREAEAEAALKKALELLPKGSEWRKRIEEATAGDDDDEMPENVTTSVSTQNDDPDFDRGFALLSSGKYTEAIASFKKSAAADPNSVTFYNIGFCYFKLNQRAAALPFLEKAVALNPKYDSAFNYLGAAYEAVEQYANAAAAFRTASKLDSSNAEYKSNLTLAERKLTTASRTNENKTVNREETVGNVVSNSNSLSPQSGLWKARITNIEGRQDTMTFRVSANGGQIEDVVFEGYWRCDDPSSSFKKGLLKKVDVNSPPGTFSITNGAFSDIKKEPYLAWTFEGVFTGATTARGTFRIEYATECDTYKLEWTAERLGK